MIEFRILGPLQMVAGSRALPLGGIKQRGVLALLLLARNRVVPRDRLVDALWSDEPPASAANSVQVYISKLRRLLDEGGEPGSLVTEPPDTYSAFHPARSTPTSSSGWWGTGWLRFARDRTPMPSRHSHVLLRSGVGRLSPTSLPVVCAGGDRSPGGAPARGAGWRLDAMLAVGRQAEAIGELQALVGLYPLDERLRAQLMTAFYGAGKQAERSRATGRTGLSSTPSSVSSPTWSCENSSRRSCARTTRSHPARESRRPARPRDPEPAAEPPKQMQDESPGHRCCSRTSSDRRRSENASSPTRPRCSSGSA